MREGEKKLGEHAHKTPWLLCAIQPPMPIPNFGVPPPKTQIPASTPTPTHIQAYPHHSDGDCEPLSHNHHAPLKIHIPTSCPPHMDNFLKMKPCSGVKARSNTTAGGKSLAPVTWQSFKQKVEKRGVGGGLPWDILRHCPLPQCPGPPSTKNVKIIMLYSLK